MRNLFLNLGGNLKSVNFLYAHSVQRLIVAIVNKSR